MPYKTTSKLERPSNSIECVLGVIRNLIKHIFYLINFLKCLLYTYCIPSLIQLQHQYASLRFKNTQLFPQAGRHALYVTLPQLFTCSLFSNMCIFTQLQNNIWAVLCCITNLKNVVLSTVRRTFFVRKNAVHFPFRKSLSSLSQQNTLYKFTIRNQHICIHLLN